MQRVPRPTGLASATLRQLRDYWLRARGTRLMPARKDIDPLAMPRLLSHIVLTDVLPDPRQFRYRLIGTFVTQLAGRDATGRWLDEALYGRRTDDILWAFRACLARLEPVAVRERVQFSVKDWIVIEALLMPIGETDEQVGMMLSGIDIAPPGSEKPPVDTAFVLDWRAG